MNIRHLDAGEQNVIRMVWMAGPQSLPKGKLDRLAGGALLRANWLRWEGDLWFPATDEIAARASQMWRREA